MADQWPNLRAMVRHGRYYSFESAHIELAEALRILDRLTGCVDGEPTRCDHSASGGRCDVCGAWQQRPAWPCQLHRGQRAVALLYPGMWLQPRYSHLPLDLAAYCQWTPATEEVMPSGQITTA